MRKGTKMTPEQLKRLSDAHKGHKLSEETKRKMSLSRSGPLNYGYGKPKTPEQKLKISLSLQGRRMPYVAEANSKRIYSEETRELRRKVAKRNWENPEYRAKMLSINVKGKNNPHYKKDRSLIKTCEDRRQDVLCKEWKTKVRNRDSWKCKINNSECSGRLEVHHILSWRNHKDLRYDINNGITLCHFHHPHYRNETEEQVIYFQKLII